MFKKIMAALSAFILAGCLYAEAEDLVIDGLGKLSFGEDVQITDGGGSRTENRRPSEHLGRNWGNEKRFDAGRISPC